MSNSVIVYIDFLGNLIQVGHLWSHSRQGKESMSFEYDRNWLSHPLRFSLDPALKLDSGAFHSTAEKPTFGAMDDSAPDRWGRMLLRRSERAKAAEERRTPRSLREFDFLLLVDGKQLSPKGESF